MTEPSGFLRQLAASVASDPLLVLSLAAALVAFSTTPLAFAILGRTSWFEARRGRTMQRPSFWSLVISMVLVMGIPAIFATLVLRSRSYDKSRYEFDPNRTLSVLDQGSRYKTLTAADEAVRSEKIRLDQERKSLVEGIKKLDDALLALRSAAVQHPLTSSALPGVLDTLGGLHKAVGLEAPQQLLSEVAPPAAIAGASLPVVSAASAPVASPANAGAPAAVAAANAFSAELATVPAPQKTLASLLPLSGVTAGWVLGEMGGKHLETFDAENMYEKINGRAESFLQYDVKGMAYAFYHPDGKPDDEAQLYVFEFASPLKSFGKYSSEKPEEAQALPIGADGYATAGSVFFYKGPYYAQIVCSSEDAKLAEFARELAGKVAQRIDEVSGASASAPPGVSASASAEVPGAGAARMASSPDELFRVLPEGPGRTGPKYIAQDAFGYSFLSDVFLADYQEGEAYWQGFVRPFDTPEKAEEVFAQYVKEVKDFGAEVQEVQAEGAKRMVLSTLDGLVDVVFVKGNALAGANGSTDRAKAESFARSYAKALPGVVPTIATTPEAKGDTEPVYEP